ncbi:beta-galactosidase trimerization domain-containing protein, partial [Rhizobium johnstonii]|uniref:beta-galactosidase trimerization domain-containing protein n=1 Tax=Rhizobium johnstonii TaxID=3019933 RepID=UPI003F99E10B
SFWAQDLEWRPSVDLAHRERVEAFYTALWNLGLTIDFVHPSADLSGYSVVFAPAGTSSFSRTIPEKYETASDPPPST